MVYHLTAMQTLPPNLERLSGSIERVTFHNAENGFCVLKVNVRGQRDLVAVIGNAACVSPGEYIEAWGFWINDSTHGLQFRAQSLQIVPPSTLEGIEKYLGSGMIRGIGPHFAKRLVKAFGEQVFEVIEFFPDRLLTLAGIGKKRQTLVVSAWAEQKVIRDIMVFLQSHGVGTSRAVRIFKTYGEQAIIKVQENPYRLALDIHGIGFKTADTIAQKLGIPADSLIRAQAGLRHVLQLCSNEGHCAAFKDTLLEKAQALLEITPDILEQALVLEANEGNIVADNIEGQPCYYLTPLFKSEVGVAKHMQRLLHGVIPWAGIEPAPAMDKVEAQTGFRLSASQRQAIELALISKCLVITGGPGVGKTTLVKSLLRIVQTKPLQVVLAAPTGRAAKRLSEATGLTAKTLHRLLAFDPQKRQFRYGLDNPLPADLVIVDEASMLDIVLIHQLLKAIPDNAGLWLIGDIDQLPSVGPGSVLADIIRSEVVPTIQLTEIFRQAASSRIIVNAHRINQGKLPLKNTADELTDFYFIPVETPEETQEKLLTLITQRIPQRFNLHPIDDIQVLTPMNRGGLGARALNTLLQPALNPNLKPSISRFGNTFAPGDKVMQTINNYDKDVFNGDIGKVESINLEDNLVLVNFEERCVPYEYSELDEIVLAYATSIHKSQGSEYPAVVIPLTKQHFMMLERNLLYTAVTRGKKLVVIVGQFAALAMAVNTLKAQKRLTKLSLRLQVL